ncbi:glycoside hydrolase family 127 protein [Actinoallomurus spadix]|uniref:Glycoside hydrolase family 127 protein n=1 Tax=Actinoallomurus spadix TaxID=79912 RepID=A0ABP3G7U8_9ACTN|nr:beta-L-arabinofuranosidase domain-containing protein [Actinoallomurus spadix]MCO5989408.1 glycoside hydrolase family 127 protein [Actinoallomurus spadix]
MTEIPTPDRTAATSAERPAPAPVVPGPGAIGALRPLDLGQVRLHPDGLLGRWWRRNATATLPHCVDRLHRSGNLANLRAAAGESEDDFRGMWFADSDVYKTLEAAAWRLASPMPGDGATSRLAPSTPGDDAASHLASSPPGDDAGLRAFVADTTALLARAQRPDGYLNSYFTLVEPDQRWRKPDWSHELYCAGHLIQAAVAAGRAGVSDELVRLARRLADLLVERFGPGGVEEVCGHPEIETALVELYRLTGHRPYLDLAARFVDLRGRGLLRPGPFGARYFQDHVPPREAREVAGHAVRQLYLLAGVVDVAVETGDEELLAAAERLWEDAFRTRTYVTGAHGSRHRDEAYGSPYELPPDRAYGETCAAIASVQYNWRLLLATGRARYADEMERALYNAVAVAVSDDGTRFFYSNPLQVRTGHAEAGEEGAVHRLPWYTCACCPPNIARLMASLPAYLATGDDDGLRIHLYGAATVDATVRGAPVQVAMRTDYPWQGRVELTVTAEGARAGGPWTLALRVPAWCAAYSVLVDGEPVRLEAVDGYLHLTRDWASGTTLVLDLDMPARYVTAHPRVDAVRGCVALTRGPLVYCLEEADLPAGVVLEDLRLDLEVPVVPAVADEKSPPAVPVTLVAGGSAAWTGDTALYRATGGPSAARGAGTARPSAACGAGTVRSFAGQGDGTVRSIAGQGDGTVRSIAGQGDGAGGGSFPLTAVPYLSWGNRAEGAMRVWIPVAGRY